MTNTNKHGKGETVYLLHFDRPYAHARHYLGYAADLDARLAQHASGNGARLLQVVMEAGISWTLARTWPGGREVEHRLKRQKNSPRLCPICQAQAQARKGKEHADEHNQHDD
jgi:predicted GIY-YIG superfamily endonuclease